MAGNEFVREVYDASYGRLVAQLLAMCGDQSEAEEAVQEAFVKALAHRGRFEQLDNPEAWLRTVAVNVLRSRWRRVAHWRRLLPSLPGITHEIALDDEHEQLLEAVRSLPRPLREVVVLHHIVDLPTREVASTLGVAEGTVKARLVRGRELLGLLLSGEEKHV